MNVRTRFAPSPTGYLHIGGLRTALYNYLFARRHGGVFIVRIEDTDRERFVPGALEHLCEVLHKVGLDYDEGPRVGGPYAPYIQSERAEQYREYAQKLLELRHAYYCFCSPQRLETLRTEQKQRKQLSKYDRTCLQLSDDERADRFKRGEQSVVRLRVPDKVTITFDDAIRGPISINSEELDDQVLLKSDGMPTYHLANVVDDHLMQISHVIRGEEWISSTPKHIILYQAFGWQPPVFAHVPLLLNPDKSKLSKRQGDVSVEDFLAQGYLSDALLNFIALLGWNPKSDQERYTLDELISLFDLAKINKAGAVLNKEKLDWLNHEYIRDLTDKQFIEAARPFLENKNLTFPNGFEQWSVWVSIEKQRIKKMNEVGEETRCLFEDPMFEDPTLLIWKQSSKESTLGMIENLKVFFQDFPEGDLLDAALIEQKIKIWIGEHGFGTGEALWPLRVALSGKKQSPGPFELAALVGVETVVKRLNYAYQILKKIS